MPAGALSPAVKRSGCKVYHPPPFNAEDKKEYRYTYTSPLLHSKSIKIHYIISETKRADSHVEGHDFPLMRSISDVGTNKFGDMNFYCRVGIILRTVS
jgi:hypothetical protein